MAKPKRKGVMKQMDRLSVAVLGATGLVGKELIRMLHDHPFFQLAGLYASEKSLGTPISELSESYDIDLKVEKSDAEEIKKKKFDVIFSAISEQSATLLERDLAATGSHVVTNASGNRMLDSTKIVVPEVNFEDAASLNPDGFILANGNCSTIGFVLGIEPLSAYGIRSAYVTTIQSLSGAGYPGVPALDILGNIIPFIPEEEEKIIRETRKILKLGAERNNFDISATCTRAPVANGHTECITLNLNEKVEYDDVRRRFIEFPRKRLPSGLPTLPGRTIIVMDDKDRPQPRLDSILGNRKSSRGMPVAIGRIRVEGHRVQFILVINNLVRGAAGSTLLNAEIAHRLGAI